MLFHEIIHNTLSESTLIPKEELGNYKSLSLGEDFPGKPHAYYKSAKNNAKKAYSFIKSHKWYDRGVRVCVAPFFPIDQLLTSIHDRGLRDYIEAGTKFYFVLVPKSLDKVKYGFANELMDYLRVTKAVTNYEFQQTHLVYTDPMNFYKDMGVREFEPTIDYNIKPKTKEAFGDILTSLDESAKVYSEDDLEFKRCGKIPHQAIKTDKNVPALISKFLKKQIVHLNEREKMSVYEAGARVVRASKQGEKDDFYILYPYKLVSKYTDIVYFIVRSLLANGVKYAGDMLYGLQINVGDADKELAKYDKVTDYELIDDYSLKSNKARESFKDILTGFNESVEKIYNEEELKNYVTISLYDYGTKEAKVLDNFIRHNGWHKKGVRIVERIVPKDYTSYNILVPKNISIKERKELKQQAYEYLQQKRVPNADNILWFMFQPISNYIDSTGFKDFDSTEEYNLKPKTKEAFGDIITSITEQASKDELDDYIASGLYVNKDMAESVYKFLRENPEFRDRGARITVRKEEFAERINPSLNQRPKGGNDLYYILLPKKMSKKEIREFNDKLNDFLAKDISYHGKFNNSCYFPAIDIFSIGSVVDFDPLEDYKMKQGSKDKFGDILTGLNEDVQLKYYKMIEEKVKNISFADMRNYLSSYLCDNRDIRLAKLVLSYIKKSKYREKGVMIVEQSFYGDRFDYAHKRKLFFINLPRGFASNDILAFKFNLIKYIEENISMLQKSYEDSDDSIRHIKAMIFRKNEYMREQEGVRLREFDPVHEYGMKKKTVGEFEDILGGLE